MQSDERTRLEILDQPESLEKSIDREYAKIQQIARKIVDRKFMRICLVGMGSSYSAALMTAPFLHSTSSLPLEIYRGYELEFEAPLGIREDCCVVLISLSGETEDVVSALRYARKRGAYTVSISGPDSNTLATEADDAIRIISKDTKAMIAAHLTQTALLLLLLGHIAKYRDGSKRVDELKQNIDGLIQRLPKLIAEQEEGAIALAEEFKDDWIFYVIGAGPSYGLAYKLAMTELTENVWVHGIVQYSTEFRHGIVEEIEPRLPVIFLIGSDKSQTDLRRELETCRILGARTIVWDAKDFPPTDEFLAPFYLSIPVSWFVYHLSLKRGRKPSARRHMGSVIPYANMKTLSA